MTTAPLFLASSSPYRKQQLVQLGLAFTSISPDVDETPLPDEPADELARRLSIIKARRIANDVEDGIIIGSDQTASCRGKQLSKPVTQAKAVEQLRWCSGNTAVFYTGICVFDCLRHTLLSEVCTTHVAFRSLSDLQIKRYIASEKPLNCAGSFKVEGLGISLFTAVTSDDPSALIGLPLISLTTMLNKVGIELP